MDEILIEFSIQNFISSVDNFHKVFYKWSVTFT